MVPATARTRAGVALLERALAHTRGALEGVSDSDGPRPTPCTAWDVTDLLVHMVDSLEVVTELAIGRVALVGPPPASRRPEVLADHLRVLGCSLLEHWTARADDVTRTVVGDAGLDPVVAAEVGALEVAVHGWDLAAARGPGATLPPLLAAALLPVAVARVPVSGRSGVAAVAGRFGAALAPVGSDPASLLLAHLGRDPRWPHLPHPRP